MWAVLGCLPGGGWEVRPRCRAGSLQEPRTGRAPGGVPLPTLTVGRGTREVWAGGRQVRARLGVRPVSKVRSPRKVIWQQKAPRIIIWVSSKTKNC